MGDIEQDMYRLEKELDEPEQDTTCAAGVGCGHVLDKDGTPRPISRQERSDWAEFHRDDWACDREWQYAIWALLHEANKELPPRLGGREGGVRRLR